MKYKNLFSCSGKIAVVTGGAGLIGREIVKALEASGATVYVADNDALKAKRLFSSRNIRFTYLDILSENSVIETFASISKQAKRIDIVVNSAYPRTKDWNMRFENVSFDSWNTNMKSHLGGYFLCCREAARCMKTGGGGSIINIGSIYGLVAPDFSIYEGTEMTMPVVYSAIKGGIVAFTKYLATYCAKDNIRANVVSPGGVLDKQTKSFVDRYSKKTPIGRMGKPSDMVGAIVFLASEASSYVTGHNLIVDGGWTVW